MCSCRSFLVPALFTVPTIPPPLTPPRKGEGDGEVVPGCLICLSIAPFRLSSEVLQRCDPQLAPAEHLICKRLAYSKTRGKTPRGDTSAFRCYAIDCIRVAATPLRVFRCPKSHIFKPIGVV